MMPHQSSWLLQEVERIFVERVWIHCMCSIMCVAADTDGGDLDMSRNKADRLYSQQGLRPFVS